MAFSALVTPECALASTIEFSFSGVINEGGDNPPAGFSAIPILPGTPFSVQVSFDEPLAVGGAYCATCTLTATIGGLHAMLTNPFVAIRLNYGFGPFASGFDILEFDTFPNSTVSGDSLVGWNLSGLDLDFYGDSGKTSISPSGITGPVDPASFTEIQDFAVFYSNPKNPYQQGVAQSLTGLLFVPEPSSLVPLSIDGQGHIEIPSHCAQENRRPFQYPAGR